MGRREKNMDKKINVGVKRESEIKREIVLWCVKNPHQIIGKYFLKTPNYQAVQKRIIKSAFITENRYINRSCNISRSQQIKKLFFFSI